MIGRERADELLEIVASFGDGGCTPEQFARAAFPDAAGWNDLPLHPRRGARRGGRMVAAGAGLLGQLRARLLVKKTAGRYVLSPKGRTRVERGGAPVLRQSVANPPEKQLLQRNARVGQMQWVADGIGGWFGSDGTTYLFIDPFGGIWVWDGYRWVCFTPQAPASASTGLHW